MTLRHKTNTSRKRSWGINFCANTCGACTGANTGATCIRTEMNSFKNLANMRKRIPQKYWGWKTSRLTPLPKRGFGPPSYGTFSTPLRCQCSLFFLYKNPRQSRPEALLEGSKIFRESEFSGTFSSPIFFFLVGGFASKIAEQTRCLLESPMNVVTLQFAASRTLRFFECCLLSRNNLTAVFASEPVFRRPQTFEKVSKLLSERSSQRRSTRGLVLISTNKSWISAPDT